MRRLFAPVFLCVLLSAATPVHAAHGRIVKVLPQLLDAQGRNSLSPSLFDRDAYQAFLRQNTNLVSGLRFAVQWKARGAASSPVKLRVEARGIARENLPTQVVLEKAVNPGGWFSRWTALSLTGDDFRNLGSVTAWRVTLWEGDHLLAEETSFLW